MSARFFCTATTPFLHSLSVSLPKRLTPSAYHTLCVSLPMRRGPMGPQGPGPQGHRLRPVSSVCPSRNRQRHPRLAAPLLAEATAVATKNSHYSHRSPPPPLGVSHLEVATTHEELIPSRSNPRWDQELWFARTMVIVTEQKMTKHRTVVSSRIGSDFNEKTN